MKLNHNYYVYILECSDGSYYTGITDHLDRRFWEHNNDDDTTAYTYSRRPLEIKYFERFQNVVPAIAREKQIKGWSGKKKEALFQEDWEEIKRLSKSATETIKP